MFQMHNGHIKHSSVTLCKGICSLNIYADDEYVDMENEIFSANSLINALDCKIPSVHNT